MPKYIDYSALSADIDSRYCTPCRNEGRDYNGVKCRACWVDDMLGEIEDAPAADVEPVRHGHYIGTEFDGYADGNPVYYEWKCSECDCVFEDDEPKYRYCPNCGAKMDKEAKDAE